MQKAHLNDHDLARMREWGISTAADTRTQAETEARFVVPEWLRRTTWRQFWAEHDPAPESGKRIIDPILPGRHSSSDLGVQDPAENSLRPRVAEEQVRTAAFKLCASEFFKASPQPSTKEHFAPSATKQPARCPGLAVLGATAFLLFLAFSTGFCLGMYVLE